MLLARNIIAFMFLSLIFSCQHIEKENAQAVKSIVDNSKTSLDWNGNYFGVLPCADCEGIETLITLNKDKTFRLVTKYSGKSETEFVDKGSFEWDESGSKIKLLGLEGAPSNYQVGENKLVQLDMNGNRITGELAEKYILEKTDRFSLLDTKWKLIELKGKPVEYKQSEKEIFLQLLSEEKKVYGFSGCNTFRGSYEIKDGSKIKFGPLASTLMACPNMKIETEFLKTLETVDNYNFDGKRLVLNRGRVAPLARFEAMK